ncbi:MAG TPA: ATP-binding protein [Ktedonobacteraceae bacterium]|nr:ATP-binding protein [Ktedonobacteraceae bacterium]
MKTRRLYVSAGTLLLYVLLVVMDLSRTFISAKDITSLSTWVYFGCSCVTALLFLAIGNLVWLYARERVVAALLFCFSLAMMVTLAVETGASANDILLSVFGDVGSQLALFFLSVLLLYFPRNYLAWSPAKIGSAGGKSTSPLHDRQYYRVRVLRSYVIILFLLSIISIALSAIVNISPAFARLIPAWLTFIGGAYAVIAIVGIFLTIVVSYRQSVSQRERQQRRLLLVGIIVSFAPVLVLTLLPELLNWSRYTVDPRISTLTLVLLPLALAYAILRYQILVFDVYIRRAIAWLVGAVNLVMLIYLAVAFSSVFLSDALTRIICVTVGVALLAPLAWSTAHLTTEKLFFSENVHYRRLVARINRVDDKTIDLREAAQLLTQAAINIIETPAACLFVLNEDSGHYLLYSPLSQSPVADTGDTDEGDLSGREVARTVIRAVDLPMHGDARAEFEWLGADVPALLHLEKSSRPLLLSEAVKLGHDMSLGLSRYLRSTGFLGVDPLLVPVRVQGKMIAVLALGQRGDKQQYAGPDFETIDLILDRFASMLENARLYAQADQHVAILNTLYSASAMLGKAFQTTEDIARVCTRIAAEATQATAMLWLYDEQEGLLRRTASVGAGPFLTAEDVLRLPQDFVWTSRFYEGASKSARNNAESDADAFSRFLCFAEKLSFPFAWIPVSRGQQHLGMLVLNYALPHIFSQQEKRVLEIFASQCAAALENTRMTSELRAAYERQQELDRLKDQFIITASHELRTPLTAVMGYIELLGEYGATLSPELLADFIAKAHRGCDELALMVENIMDASRVQVDADKIRLGKVPLAEPVKHILEIMEAVTRRERRTIEVNVPEHLIVEADDMRLRQVLLNLVNNALKYSPAGTSVVITASSEGEQVIVSVRDHGSGVPSEERERLFERFMRLERDMNSPVRGAGLGLYICKQLVEAMDGHIWVESTGVAGEGSTFAFSLHRAAVLQPQALPHA